MKPRQAWVRNVIAIIIAIAVIGLIGSLVDHAYWAAAANLAAIMEGVFMLRLRDRR